MKICILTDTTAIFSQATFTGHHLVKVIAMGIQTVPTVKLIPPTLDDFLREYAMLGRSYDHILVAVMSNVLNPIAEVATLAAIQHGGRASITVVETQNIGAGLGLIVELAAQEIQAGKSVSEIEQQIRAAIPHIYSLFCIPDFSHMAQIGYLSKSQANVGELIGLFPIFMLEEGRLSPLEKVRTQRHLIESFQEFISEYDNPGHIALLKGPLNRLRTRPLRQYVNELFPEMPYKEHTLNAPLTALFGNQAVGLVIADY
jgi:DegV family protein with EDD domain